MPRRSRGALGRMRSEIRAVTAHGHRVACIQSLREAGKGPEGSKQISGSAHTDVSKKTTQQ